MEGKNMGSIKFDFNGKVAVVTGGASGIGLACAEMLAENGARLALVDYSNPLYTQNLASAVENVKKKGFAQGYGLDVTDTSAIGPTISQIRQEIGEIDILVCSAGINRPSPLEELTEADWDAVLSTNLKGLFFCNQAVAVQSMIPLKSGVIVNIASIFGLVGTGSTLSSAGYCSSKGGVVQLTRKEAAEWAKYNIRVNAVAPTFTATIPLVRDLKKIPGLEADIIENTPLHRMANLDEVACATCFLASDAVSIITGVTLPVDGGWTAQ
jgi:NAD(P)-dependent dehydrogenase (short-subunit alcohol dehydrogenase family)